MASIPSFTERVSFSVFSEKSWKDTLFSSLILSKFPSKDFRLERDLSLLSSLSLLILSMTLVMKEFMDSSFFESLKSILSPMALISMFTLAISLSKEAWKREKDSWVSCLIPSRSLKISSSPNFWDGLFVLNSNKRRRTKTMNKSATMKYSIFIK